MVHLNVGGRWPQRRVNARPAFQSGRTNTGRLLLQA